MYIQYLFDMIRNKLQLMIHNYTRVKRRSKVQEKIMSRSRALNFDQ